MKISRLYFVALGALILFAAGCGGNGSVVPAGAGNLTGYIYTRSYNSGSAARQTMRAASATVPDGYIPVSGAKVELLNNNIDPVTTGSDGMFLFTNLTAGRYTVRVTKKDPVTNADILTPLEFQVTVSQNVTNVVNDSFAATDISMDPIATGTLTVTASVDCAVAVPVNGEVYINDVNTFATTPIALFNDIGVGTYRVHVNAAGYQVPPDKDAIITQGGSINLAFILAPQGNATPFATIATPADNATVVAGNAVALTGGAVDCEDGNLTGAALAWTSSIDGALGTGAALSLTTLSIGTHTITLKATDSDGAFTTASITLNVNAAGSNTAPTASLIAPANGAV
ncbi:MAG: prealbumin-like fold domain-containing protein, partial [bacterium]